MASVSPQVTSIHHYHRPPRLTAGAEVLQQKDYQVRFQLTFLERHRDHSDCLGQHPGFVTAGCQSCHGFSPHGAGGSGSVSLCEGMHWPNWHHFLFHHLLSSYCLTVLGYILFAITPGSQLNKISFKYAMLLFSFAFNLQYFSKKMLQPKYTFYTS